METLRAVEGHLRAALAEFAASPDRTEWPNRNAYQAALALESSVEELLQNTIGMRLAVAHDLNGTLSEAEKAEATELIKAMDGDGRVHRPRGLKMVAVRLPDGDVPSANGDGLHLSQN